MSWKKSKSTDKRDAYQRVTDAVTAAIETMEKLPWQCGWVRSRRQGGQALRSDGKPYRGGNQFILSIIAMSRGYTSPYWLTMNKIRELTAAKRTVVDQVTGEILQEKGRWIPGNGVQKGEKASPSIYFNTVRVKDREAAAKGEDKTRPLRLIRYNNVWNADQVVDLPERYYVKPEPEELPGGFEPLEEAQKILDGFFSRTGAPEIQHKGDRAYYRPLTDMVNLPELDRFESPEAYYATAFHEAGHSTGHRDRLDRESLTGFHRFGDAEYSREELVAELTAAFLLGDAGIATSDTTRNTVAYLQSWLKALKDNPKWLVWAAGRAEKAAHWIHTGTVPVYESLEAKDEGPGTQPEKVVGFLKAAA